MRRAPPRVAVTGIGLISALGDDREQTFARVVRSERGFDDVRSFDTSGMRTRVAAEVIGLEPAKGEARPGIAEPSRTDRLALSAAHEAVRHARLDSRALAAAGLAVGASTGALFEAERYLLDEGGPEAASRTARHLLTNPISATTRFLARDLGIRGPSSTLCTACSSGAVAMVQAVAWLRSGRVSTVLAGAADGLCRMTFAGFNSLGALSRDGARPFDRARDGLTLGEGAGFLVLESEDTAAARGAEVLAWLDGWCVAAEAHHITQPDTEARTATMLLGRALEVAGVSADRVGFVNAHGTGTEANDRMEARALSAVLKGSLGSTPISGSKGQLGHTLAAAGAIESALGVMALARRMVPPCGGLNEPDPELGTLRLSSRAKRADFDSMVCCSYGFGGTGCVLVFSAKQRQAPLRQVATTRVYVSAATSVGPGGRLRDGEHVAYTLPDAPVAPARLAREPLDELAAERSRRFDRLTALSALAVDDALRAVTEPGSVGLCLGVAWFGIGRTIRFLERLKQRGARGVNPGEFPHLVPSSPAGNVSIYCGIQGPVVTVAAGETSGTLALSLAADLLSLGLARHMIVAASAEHEPLLAEMDEPNVRSEGSACLVLSAPGQAVAKAGRPLALLGPRASASDLERGLSEFPGPGLAECARVVYCGGSPIPSLAATPWRDVPVLGVQGSVGSHEAGAAFALTGAVALVARGEAERVLVVVQGELGFDLVLFESPTEGS